VVQTQTASALEGLSAAELSRIVIAYEPVWAIGTGRVATPEIAESMHRYIRGLVSGLFGQGIAESLPVLYGGSVKPDNIAGLYRMDDIDGVLVGGASLKAQSFLDIIHVSK
jgi:triosephosphate isomerase